MYIRILLILWKLGVHCEAESSSRISFIATIIAMSLCGLFLIPVVFCFFFNQCCFSRWKRGNFLERTAEVDPLLSYSLGSIQKNESTG